MSISVTNGKNFQIKKKVAGVDLNMYPITRIGNVYNSSNQSLDNVIAALRTVPAAPETGATVKFLRGDGTWQEISAGSTSAAGLIQLSDTVETDSTKAATPTAVKSVSDALTTFTGTTAPATYMAIADYNFGTYVADKTNVATLDSTGKVPSTQLTMSDSTSTDSSTTIASAAAVKSVADALSTFTGTTAPATYVAASAVGANSGVAPLNSSGLIDEAYLPSYVDDVVEGYMTEVSDVLSFSLTDGGSAITPESGKIYVDLTTNKTYRWSGTVYVEISKSLVVGTTTGTAYDGAAGNTLRGDVDTHLADTSNPHSVTASQVGLGNVENKSGATIVSENVTASYIKTTLGAATASADGYMTSSQAAALANTQAIEVIYQDETATITDGFVFEILENAPVAEPEGE